MSKLCVNGAPSTGNAADAIAANCWSVALPSVAFPAAALGYLLLGVVILLVATLPVVLWRKLQQKADVPRDDLPLGGEVARRMLDDHDLRHVEVYASGADDHYRTDIKGVVLSEAVANMRSVAAMAIAAHEAAHALQHEKRDTSLRVRMGLGSMIYVSLGVVGLAILAVVLGERLFGVRLPMWLVAVCALGLLLAYLLQGVAAIPNEFDASFGKALPYLRQSGLLSADDLPAARRVLFLAATTYVVHGLLLFDLIALPLIFYNTPTVLRYFGLW